MSDREAFLAGERPDDVRAHENSTEKQHGSEE